jgi:hypothetical protein
MRGLVADANIQGQVEHLVSCMRAEPWADFWEALGLVLYRFNDIYLNAMWGSVTLPAYQSECHPGRALRQV